MKLTEKQKLEIIREYISGKTISDLAKEYNVCKNNINQLLDRRKVEKRTSRQSKRLKYPLKEDVFDEITEESAYWIGFLMADGCIKKVNSYKYITLSLGIGDENHVEKFKFFMGATNHKVMEVKKRNSLQKMVSFGSQKIFDKLIEYGVTPRKIKTAKVVDILKFNRHFWRGVIDGDGRLVLSQGKYPELILVGSHILCEQFSDYAKTLVPESFSNIYSTKSIYGWSASASHAVIIIKELYNDCKIALDRKLEKATQFIGWKPSEKIKNRQSIKYNGKTQPISKWVKELGIPESIVRNRLSIGWSIEDAFLGKDREIKELYRQAKANGVSARVFKIRLKNGLSVKEAMQPPLKVNFSISSKMTGNISVR